MEMLLHRLTTDCKWQWQQHKSELVLCICNSKPSSIHKNCFSTNMLKAPSGSPIDAEASAKYNVLVLVCCEVSTAKNLRFWWKCFTQKTVACTAGSFHSFIIPVMCNNTYYGQENLQSPSFRSKVRLEVIPQLSVTALPTPRSLCMKDCMLSGFCGNVCAVLPDVWHMTSSDQGFIQDFELGGGEGGQDDSSMRKCV